MFKICLYFIPKENIPDSNRFPYGGAYLAYNGIRSYQFKGEKRRKTGKFSFGKEYCMNILIIGIYGRKL